MHKTQQNDKVHLKTDNPSAVYDHKYVANSKHCKTTRSNPKPMTSIFWLKKNKEFWPSLTYSHCILFFWKKTLNSGPRTQNPGQVFARSSVLTCMPSRFDWRTSLVIHVVICLAVPGINNDARVGGTTTTSPQRNPIKSNLIDQSKTNKTIDIEICIYIYTYYIYICIFYTYIYIYYIFTFFRN